MDTFQTRLKTALLKKADGNASELARNVGVSPQAAQKWLDGDTQPGPANLRKIAEYLGLSEAMLKFGVDSNIVEIGSSGGVVAHHPDDPIRDDYVYVRESKVYFSAGNGHTANYETITDEDPAQYRLSWFQDRKINPERVRRFRVTGESMEPLLFENDTILVNLTETQIIDGKLYAIRYGDDLRVKYVSRRLDGTLILKSVNPDYPPEEVPAEVAEEHISIIGRVRDKSGEGGL